MAHLRLFQALNPKKRFDLLHFHLDLKSLGLISDDFTLISCFCAIFCGIIIGCPQNA